MYEFHPFTRILTELRSKKMTNWMTTDEVKKAAAGTLLEALECSREHHRQGAECGYKELVQLAADIGSDHTQIYYCALCNMFKDKQGSPDCRKCPLDACDEPNSTWGPVNSRWYDFRCDHSRANFTAFQEAEAKMVAKLDELIAEEKGKGRIRVPEGIEFQKSNHANYPGKIGIRFNSNKQSLMYNHMFGVWTVLCVASKNTTPLYLVPCKREDLKPGDWAAGRNCQSVKHDDFRFYHLILDDKRHIFIGDSGIPEIECSCNTYWWKVVEGDSKCNSMK